ncbi:MAG TPA: hypothetical protein PLV92_16890, partial [Pirellulaceae bacterium]|nr:hypothetical protein [Pirellulaceae bacterium]
IDDVLQEQNACVMGLKTLAALLDGRKNAIEKQIKVFAAVATGLEKLYEPMEGLTSKAINIEGGGNFRAQAGYADGYNREQLDNDLAGVETGIDAYTTRLGQLVNLEEKASQIIQKLFDGVPDEIRDRATIVAMIDDVQKKWDKVRQDSESARERLTAAINRGGELVTYLKGRIKAISR